MMSVIGACFPQNDPSCLWPVLCLWHTWQANTSQGGNALIFCPISRVNCCLRQSKCPAEILSQYHGHKIPESGRGVSCRGVFNVLLYIASSLLRTLLKQSNRVTRKPESDVILIWMALKRGSQEDALSSATQSNFTGKGRSSYPVFLADELCWIIQYQKCMSESLGSGGTEKHFWACILGEEKKKKLKVSAWNSPKKSLMKPLVHQSTLWVYLWVAGWSACLLEVWEGLGSVLKLVCYWIGALE